MEISSLSSPTSWIQFGGLRQLLMIAGRRQWSELNLGVGKVRLWQHRLNALMDARSTRVVVGLSVAWSESKRFTVLRHVSIEDVEKLPVTVFVRL
jgi:hypothetical protein